jgi:hypothetical protein
MIGMNGKYGDISKRMTCTITHFMTKDTGGLAVGVAL